jgi:hypothetical protein
MHPAVEAAEKDGTTILAVYMKRWKPGGPEGESLTG